MIYFWSADLKFNLIIASIKKNNVLLLWKKTLDNMTPLNFLRFESISQPV